MCTTRKLKVSYLVKDEDTIMTKLGLREPGPAGQRETKTVELDVPATEELYQALLQCGDLLLDWEFLDDKGGATKRVYPTGWDEEKAQCREYLKREFFKDGFLRSTDILCLLKAVLELKQKSPALRVSQGMLEKTYERYTQLVAEPGVTEEEVFILYFLDGYNSVVPGSILDDLLGNLKTAWHKVQPGWGIKQFVEEIYQTKLAPGELKFG